MLRKVLIGTAILVVAGGIGLFFWARAVLTGDAVRDAVAHQLSKTLGQPVSIGTLSASIFPRVTMALGDVTIGQPASLTVKKLNVGTSFRALLSRRIEHATVRLDDAVVQLPLPLLATVSSGTPADQPPAPSSMPVEIVSIDEIRLANATVTSGGRTVHADIDLSMAGQAVVVNKVTLKADAASIEVSGRIDDLAGPSGTLSVKAGALNLLDLAAFASDFSASASPLSARAAAARTPTRAVSPGSSGLKIAMAISADRATLGTLVLGGLTGQATLTSAGVVLDPVHFALFGGTYEGALRLGLEATPVITVTAKMSGIDMAAVTAFVNAAGTMTGRMNGSIEVTARGTDPAGVVRTATGTARIDVADGKVKGLGLVRGIVLATSGRQDSRSQIGGTTADEPFSRLGATLAIGDGRITTQNLLFVSKDIQLSAAGRVGLDGRDISIAGPLQLSDELSQQAGRDLLRYTQKDGRVTVPAHVTGSAESLHVGIDVGDMAKSALSKAAMDEAKKALLKRIGRGGGGG